MDIKINLALLVLFNALLTLPATDVFSSTAQLRSMAASEGLLAGVIEEYIENEERKLQQIKGVLNRVKDQGRTKAEDVEHPIVAYKMIRKWRTLLASSGDTNNIDLWNRWTMQGQPFLTDVDLMGTLAALIRLQRTYSLPTGEMYHGIIQGHRAEPLTPHDAYDLGVAAMTLGEYSLAAEWLQIASFVDPSSAPYSVASANFELAKAYYFIGDYGTATIIMKNALAIDPFNETIKLHTEIYARQNESMYQYNDGRPYNTLATWKKWMPDWKEKYEKLCRGEFEPRNDTDKPQMFCRYRKTSVPYYVVKEEVLSVEPWIAQLYEVIHKDEMQRIKDIATPQLFRAQVGDPAKALTSDERVSKVAWLWDTGEDNFIPNLSKRVSLITGLDTTYRLTVSSAEPFQVVNYGIGGQYEPHYDFYEEEAMKDHLPTYLLNTGDRIVTFMYYLSTVKGGGATVFPHLDVRVPAVEGSAAYWFNIKKSGEYDKRTQHAGCPVLIGEKWVANKWIREYGQEFRRPCGLTLTAEEDGY